MIQEKKPEENASSYNATDILSDPRFNIALMNPEVEVLYKDYNALLDEEGRTHESLTIDRIMKGLESDGIKEVPLDLLIKIIVFSFREGEKYPNDIKDVSRIEAKILEKKSALVEKVEEVLKVVK